VSHLQFAYDTLIFCDATSEKRRHLPCIFLCFEAILGLKINLAKLEIVPVSEVGDVEGLACSLGCRVFSLPMKYLGLSLDAAYRAISIWNDIIEKMEGRLAGWKKLYLSIGGRLTLIKSTLSNLPTYFSFPYSSGSD
jgi:hypothetical protein